jgi:hypothetical protein
LPPCAAMRSAAWSGLILGTLHHLYRTPAVSVCLSNARCWPLPYTGLYSSHVLIAEPSAIVAGAANTVSS